MKKSFLAGVALVYMFISISFGQEIRKGSSEILKAMKDGPMAKVTLKIVDADGIVVPSAKVLAHFEMAGRQGITGTADTNGVFSMEDKSRGEMHYGVAKEGYYSTSSSMTFDGLGNVIIKDGKWQPWNPVITVVLKKIKNPVPMYEKVVSTTIPSANQCFGFDLQQGDWVLPVGKGVVSDFVFKVEGFWINYRNNDAKLSLSFSNPKDGVYPFDYSVSSFGIPSGSKFYTPQNAELDGYVSIAKWRKTRLSLAGEGKDVVTNDFKKGKGYVLQVRSVTNEFGIVSNACYGVLLNDIEFGGAGTNGCYLRFTYCFNPTPNDRNLEFDPKRNLFKNLKSTEQVNMP